MDAKKMTVANFNVVFGEQEEPLLDYFKTIVMPALTRDFVRTKGDCDYILLNVEVKQVKDQDDYVLTGLIVKSTVLEVLSKFDDKERFISTNEAYPTAPYSIFVIYLKNHRMVLVRNQKGSPDIRSFTATVRFFLDSYIREVNKISAKKEGEVLPFPIVNIVGVPMRGNLENVLRNVSSINRLKLKFYPLNGDIDFSGLFAPMITELRREADSKTGSIILNTPHSVDGIKNIITASQGTVDPVINVTYPDKTKGKITNNMLSENLDIEYDNDNINEAIDQIIDKTKDMDSIKSVSIGNRRIFNRKINDIKLFLRKG